MDRLKYYSCCVDYPDVDELNHIVDNSREISYRTFRSHVDSENFNTIKEKLGYTNQLRKNCNLTLQNDYAVSFHKSRTPEGKPVYFLRHSAIEYVFK